MAHAFVPVPGRKIKWAEGVLRFHITSGVMAPLGMPSTGKDIRYGTSRVKREDRESGREPARATGRVLAHAATRRKKIAPDNLAHRCPNAAGLAAEAKAADLATMAKRGRKISARICAWDAHGLPDGRTVADWRSLQAELADIRRRLVEADRKDTGGRTAELDRIIRVHEQSYGLA